MLALHVASGQALDIPAAFPTHTYELIIQLLSYPVTCPLQFAHTHWVTGNIEWIWVIVHQMK